MRFDSLGMFWEDVQVETKRGARVERPMPPIPETAWVAPTQFPNLKNARCLAVDTETWDPDLEDFGPGWGRGKGHIVGVSVAADNDGRWYFPMRHETEPHTNMNPDHVLAWLKDSMADPKQPKIGANMTYDYGWLMQEGVTLAGELIDVQFAEALLDERAHVSLDILGQKYLNNGKDTGDLYPWLADWFGGAVGGGQRKHIYRAPPRLVGPYAEGDVDLPMRLAPILYQHLHNEGLTELFSMECRLIRLMVEMRIAGVTVDIPKAQILADDLLARGKVLQEKLDYFAGQNVDINSSSSLARAFDRFGIPYGKTPKGAPSFTKDFLGTVEHPMADLIKEIRKLEKLRSTFIQSYLLDSHVNGKVYGQFHQLRGDSGGTRSGRLSSSTPNLQNIPSRDDELAPLIRGMFIPDAGHLQWRKYDYSQIEYRFLIHYAVGPGSEEARRLFNANPDTDYHEMALDLVGPEAGWDVSTPELRKKHRRPIKNINFGLIFGMGVPKLTASLGLSPPEGKSLFAAYHRGVPFAKPTMDACSAEASSVGNITTIMGRKSRFDLWESNKWQGGDDGRLGLNYQQAIMRFGGDIRRAFTHKALNRRLQGSAADLMKKAMLVCYESGIFHATGVPRLTVHDELDFSDPGGRDEAFEAMKHVMETAIPLKIPVRADGEIGPDWGHVK